MNGAHLHLLVNHLPIVGAMLAVPLVALALWLPAKRGLVLAAAVVLTLGALGGGASLWTGEEAEDVAERLADVRKDDIHVHEERGEVAAALAAVAALASLGAAGLEWRRSAPVPRGLLMGVLAISLVSAGAMAWTGASGGVIRHTEIRSDAPAQAGLPEPPASGRSEHHDHD